MSQVCNDSIMNLSSPFKQLFIILVILVQIHNVALKSQDEQCQNNPSYEYRPAFLHQNVVQALTNKSFVESAMYVPKQYNHLERVFIYHVKGKKKGQEFIICTTPKSGNTRTKMVWKKILDPSYKGGVSKDLYDYLQYDPLEWAEASRVENLLSNPNIPRFIVVRDPYTRAISMYNDKIIGLAEKQHYTYRQKLGIQKYADVSFDDFVHILYLRMLGHRLQMNKQLDRHFISQSNICGLYIGMTYNYILKQENINEWFDCYIDEINAREEVMHGWPRKNDCYFSTPRNPCKGPKFVDGQLIDVKKHTKRHQTNSVQYLQQYYKNKTTLQIIGDIYKEDFINFNYSFMV